MNIYVNRLTDPEAAWTDSALPDRIIGALSALNDDPSPLEVVRAIGAAQSTGFYGYDSWDREMAFQSACVIYGRDYEDFYQAWLHGPDTLTCSAPVAEMVRGGLLSRTA